MSRWLPWLDRNSLLAVFLVAGLGVFLTLYRIGEPLRSASYNTLFALRPTIPVTNALVVFIDEESHRELDQPLNAPWDRRLHARLLRRLKAAGARAVVFDVVFVDSKSRDPERLEADRELAAASAEHGVVVVGANPLPVKKSKGRIEPDVDLPYEALRNAVDDRWGVVEMRPDYDQVVRTHPPSYYPFKHSLAWQTALLMDAPVVRGTNDTQLERAETTERWLNYYGPANWLLHLSYFQALDPAQAPDHFFKDRIVFIGSSTMTKYSNDRKDSYISPFGQFRLEEDDQFISGVEIQATTTLNLLRGDWLRWPGRRFEIVLALAAGTLAAVGLLKLRPAWATVAAGSGCVGITVGVLVVFARWHLWFAWLIPVIQVLAAWLFSLVANSVRLYVHNKLLEQTLSLYVTPKLARKLAREGGGRLLKPGAEKQELTIFFSDIAGFTTITEGLDSNELAPLMNHYFETAVGRCIHPTDGTVVKYIGDAIFAFWNAPEPQPDHAVRACEAALLFRSQVLHEINGRELLTRIGLHTGFANVGNFGSTTRVDYTALGENINLASRMEGLNKHLGTETLLTGNTFSQVGGKFHTRYLGKFKLKGFERVVEVHELVGSVSAENRFADRDRRFTAGVGAFQKGDLDGARRCFQDVLGIVPADGPTRFYLHILSEMSPDPVAADWTGSIELHEK